MRQHSGIANYYIHQTYLIQSQIDIHIVMQKKLAQNPSKVSSARLKMVLSGILNAPAIGINLLLLQ